MVQSIFCWLPKLPGSVSGPVHPCAGISGKRCNYTWNVNSSSPAWASALLCAYQRPGQKCPCQAGIYFEFHEHWLVESCSCCVPSLTGLQSSQCLLSPSRSRVPAPNPSSSHWDCHCLTQGEGTITAQCCSLSTFPALHPS